MRPNPHGLCLRRKFIEVVVPESPCSAQPSSHLMHQERVNIWKNQRETSRGEETRRNSKDLGLRMYNPEKIARSTPLHPLQRDDQGRKITPFGSKSSQAKRETKIFSL